MRSLIPVLALALAACGGTEQAANVATVADEGDANQVTAVNDITAIDAATGEAANMAADVNYMLEDDSNATDGNAAGNASSNSASDER